MVNAREWINKNYPLSGTCQRKEDQENYGKRREEIINLDISNQNLEGDLGSEQGWINLRRLNVSFNNNVFGLVVNNWNILEEIDYSFNKRVGDWGINGSFLRLRRLNLSHNNINRVTLYNAPNLTHLYCNNNSFTQLDLQKNFNLQLLDCSNNPLTDLILTRSPEIFIFNDLVVKTFKEENKIDSSYSETKEIQYQIEIPPKY